MIKEKQLEFGEDNLKEVAIVESKSKRSVEKIKPNKEVTMEMILYEAVQQGTDADSLTKLVELKERLDAKVAEKAFNEAMAKFQKSVTSIVGKKTGSKTKSGEVVFKYAPIEDIMNVIRKPLADNGLSVKFDSKLEDKKRTTICTAIHELGHREIATFESEIDPGTSLMNPLQKQGSTLSYGRRYALIMVLGLVVENEDDDGDSSGNIEDVINQKQIKELNDLLGTNPKLLQTVLDAYKIDFIENLRSEDFVKCKNRINKYKSHQVVQEITKP